jgi:8-oxo-dGTP diphosphatase
VGIVAVVMRGELTLVIRRGRGVSSSGYICPLSGKVEPGESEPATLVREVREEVGLEVRPIRRVWECVSADGAYDLHWWLAEYIGGELALDAREVSGAWWVLPSDVPSFPDTFAGDRKFYSDVLPGLPELRSDAV